MLIPTSIHVVVVLTVVDFVVLGASLAVAVVLVVADAVAVAVAVVSELALLVGFIMGVLLVFVGALLKLGFSPNNLPSWGPGDSRV